MNRCSVSGCDAQAQAKSYCGKHYKRLLKHGDPLHVIGTPSGAAINYYNEVVLKYEGDDCLIWPFARSANGYGSMGAGGRSRTVSRLVCQAVHGDPPTETHQAAHSCGEGAGGCVAKKHLSWKTPSENTIDKFRSPSANAEERKIRGLTRRKVEEIRALRTSGASMYRLAKIYGVSEATVSGVVNGRTWKWLLDTNRNEV